jgi:uncharacterized protein YkwD
MSTRGYLTAVLVGVVASTTLLATPASAAPASMRSAVIRLTNAERTKVGCPVLTGNVALNRAAQRHSADMANHNFVDHPGSNGSTVVSRVEAAGYTGWRAVAENVAGGQVTAAGVVRSWMSSPGHRANILNCSLEDIGVGYVKKSGNTRGTYWTQDFGAKF